jgi:hypothetical protein
MTAMTDEKRVSDEPLACPFCGGEASVVTQDVEPQGDPWYGKKLETFVRCTRCGATLFDIYFHEGFGSKAAAIAAWNRRSQEPDGWRPIETAPKDGSPILIWQPDAGFGGKHASHHMPIGALRESEFSYSLDDPRLQWYDDARVAIGYWRPWGGWGNRNCADVRPTHWQPLPSPNQMRRSKMSDHCATCQTVVPIDLLDAKPTMTFWLRIIRALFGQRAMLSYAAGHGYDFDRLECKDCYGPEYRTP